ncbi:kinase-like protein [Schizophyllum commune Tattone D]|nr:kinase-like protein [Schizophyllum commune Tattone D]
MSSSSEREDLEPEDFMFSPFEGLTESLICYQPQGYHPLKIGDVLSSSSSRYRIMHKLGFGGYATVWLAQKLDEPGTFVALKITTALGQGDKEATMLEAAANGWDDVRPSHVLNLQDKFELSGPNGIHAVLVTEVLVPLLALKQRPLSPRWRKVAAYGLVQALAQLHRVDVVHGDFHLGNAGVAVRQLSKQSPSDIMEELGDYDLTVVLTVDPAKQTPSLPPYIVAPCDLADYYMKTAGDDAPLTKIFDFGNAVRAGIMRPTWSCAVEACAPEVSFARFCEGKDTDVATKSADIWSLGSAIYELIAMSPLFYGIGHYAVIERAINLAGYVPAQWQTWWESKNHLPLTDDAEAFWAEARRLLRAGCCDDADTDGVISLLRKVLALEPSARPSCEEILQDPWFREVA